MTAQVDLAGSIGDGHVETMVCCLLYRAQRELKLFSETFQPSIISRLIVTAPTLASVCEGVNRQPVHGHLA